MIVKTMYHSVILVLCTVYFIHGALYEGEQCIKDGLDGVCVNMKNCQVALNELKKGKRPQICSFDNADSIVCCLDNLGTTSTQRPQIHTTPRPTPPTTTEYYPPEPVYVDISGNTASTCEPLDSSQTAPKTGQKAWDKCIEYQEQLVYPCVKGVALSGELGRVNRCAHNADELIIGGVNAAFNEFPHMVLLGYGSDVTNLKWHCGGSLISDRFVLTAGHCIAHRDDGPITYAFPGILRRSESANEAKRYKIKNIIQHPNYNSPIKYNDIALLELDRVVKLDQYTVPACLHVGNAVKDDRASTTGWGVSQYQGSVGNTPSVDILQKVVLTKFTKSECSAKYISNRLMKQGVIDSQVCYGDKTMSRDTCQGDSGGPLQIKSRNISCMYELVGVTSFGSACGVVGLPGIYTRVAPYVSWIESIVWP